MSELFPADALVPADGEINGTIFENPHIGLARNLFWGVTVDFEPVTFDGEEWRTSATCEWIPADLWGARAWEALDGKALDCAYGEHEIEASFYLFEHHAAERVRLSLRRVRENLFAVEMELSLDPPPDLAGMETIKVAAELPLTGVHVPQDLLPAPPTAEAARQVAAQFIDLAHFDGPNPALLAERWAIFEPMLTSQEKP
jgi:hypothetical protein